MENTSRADGLTKLAQAAAELAKAAATLSEAAYNVANMFSSESNNAPSGFVQELGEAGGTGNIIDELAMKVEASLSIPDQAETNALKPYRIFVDYETDVLVYTCALIRNRNRVICYVNHGVSVLELYATLFRAVCSMVVYTIENTAQGQLDRACSLFLNSNNSVLLLPETVSLNIKLPGSDSWVVHVGWPVDMSTYLQHIQNHEARHNLFIAHSDDRRNHASSVDLTHQSIPWPGDIDSLKQMISELRPSFKQRLLEVPIELKEKAYLDYIACHGPHGHRNFSWDPSTLAYYANLYLLDVLQYVSPDDDGTEGMEPSLPEVSPEFVKRHGLEPAVSDGAIRIEEVDPGLNHMSSFPKDDHMSIGTAGLNKTDVSSSHPGGSRPGPNLPGIRTETPSLGQNGHPASSASTMPAKDESRGQNQSPALNPWDKLTNNAQPRTGSQSISSQSTLVREYLIIETEFDIIPTICHLAKRESASNAICFFKCPTAAEALIEPMRKVVSKPIYMVRVGGPLNNPTKEALRSASGCIVLCDMFWDLHPELSNYAFDLVIHVGWPEDESIYEKHTQLPGLNTSNVVLSRKELNGSGGYPLLAGLGRMDVSAIDPTTKRDFNRQTALSTIAQERVLWRDVLASITSAAHVRSYYMAWITFHFSGHYKQQGWTAIDVVNNANKHVKEALLHGYGRQGNPVRGRPSVTAGYVAHFHLEDAVAAGVLNARA